MCEQCAPAGGWTRRGALGLFGAGVLGAGAAAGAVATGVTSASAAPGIRPRQDWAGSTHPPGHLVAEPDVRFLAVHHTVNGNAYTPDQVPGMLRAIHRFHTGPERGWPDIAYNFVVDRFGGIWEARAGSLHGPVAGDATGGNQGSDQKAAFLGDHRHEPPTPEATDAMARLLAALADRYGIDTTPGATATFVSRGSNRIPAGVAATVATICGHRALSHTECPGAAGDAVVGAQLPAAVSALRAGGTPPPAPPPHPAPDPHPGTPAEAAPDGASGPVTTALPAEVSPPTTTITSPSPVPAPSPTITAAEPAGPLVVQGSATPTTVVDPGAEGGGGIPPVGPIEAVAGAVVVGAGLLVAFRNRTAR